MKKFELFCQIYVCSKFKDDVQANEVPGFNHSYKASYYKLKKHPFESLFGWKIEEKENEEELEQRKQDQEKKRKKGVFTHNVFSPGLGLFRFTHRGEQFYALHQALGISHHMLIYKSHSQSKVNLLGMT